MNCSIASISFADGCPRREGWCYIWLLPTEKLSCTNADKYENLSMTFWTIRNDKVEIILQFANNVWWVLDLRVERMPKYHLFRVFIKADTWGKTGNLCDIILMYFHDIYNSFWQWEIVIIIVQIVLPVYLSNDSPWRIGQVQQKCLLRTRWAYRPYLRMRSWQCLAQGTHRITAISPD